MAALDQKVNDDITFEQREIHESKTLKYPANSGNTVFGWQRSALEQFECLQTCIDRETTVTILRMRRGLIKLSKQHSGQHHIRS